ncbi:MAG TPA: PepSY-associated TM helix domain-containing protein, partial [Cellvibrio sp.]
MKNGFRQSMAWLHTWTGLVVGWVLFFVFVTGNLGRFDTEIDQWMMPEAIPQQVSLQQQIDVAQQRLEQRAATAERWTIYPTTNRDTPYLRIRSDAVPQGDQVNGKRTEEFLDAHTGEPLDARATGGGQLLYKM